MPWRGSYTTTFLLLVCSHVTIAIFMVGQQGQMSSKSYSDVQKEGHGNVGEDELSSSEGDGELDSAEIEEWRKRIKMYGAWLDELNAQYMKSKPKLFSRLSRGRLGRMPLAYGKRSSMMVDSPEFQRVVRNKLNRMPLTFGKRWQNGEPYLDDIISRLITNNGALSRQVISKLENTNENLNTHLETPEEPFSRYARARLTRMPLTFGKRSFDNFYREVRSRMNRMPLTYGKRSEIRPSDDFEENDHTSLNILAEERANNPNSDEYQMYLDNLNQQLQEPVTFNDRQEQDENENTLVNSMSPYEPLIRVRRSRLARMPAAFGKRDRTAFPTPSYNYPETTNDLTAEKLLVETRSRMHRMPMAFGKRHRTAPVYAKRYRLDRMPMSFGKRTAPDNSDTADSGIRFGSFTDDVDLDRFESQHKEDTTKMASDTITSQTR
ncbi:uncharacterized protein LOC131935596 [Physella acuta]|uniref:uncharacterized protein LOC131935596 n=1 Tax=Physella acuta TaxID=109671 RepID=UPI0027DBA1B6|nr:uncharacterized protein LOC131935596 [Physella acuta]